MSPSTSSAEQAVSGESAIRPFHVGFAEAELTELRRRINATRWPERETVTDDSQGVPLATMEALARYWGTDYDWRKCEAQLSALPHFVTEIDTFGVCHRFPNLPFVSVESGFGFVPFLIEALDWQWRHMSGPTRMPERLLPSEYFRRQIYATFWFEQSTLAQLPDWVDNVMFETDYPHNTCLIPGSQVAPAPKQVVARHIDRFGEELMSKVLYKNAARVYGLEIASSSAGSP
jgi:predicted TIM-barrel fold metal-dependent hydrolase